MLSTISFTNVTWTKQKKWEKKIWNVLLIIMIKRRIGWFLYFITSIFFSVRCYLPNRTNSTVVITYIQYKSNSLKLISDWNIENTFFFHFVIINGVHQIIVNCLMLSLIIYTKNEMCKKIIIFFVLLIRRWW